MERQQEIQVKSTKFAKKLEKKKTAEKLNMASLTCRHEKKTKNKKGTCLNNTNTTLYGHMNSIALLGA